MTVLMHLAQSACKSTQEAIQAAKQAIVQKEEEHCQVCKELQQLNGSSSLPASWPEAKQEAVSTSYEDHIVTVGPSVKDCCSSGNFKLSLLVLCHVNQPVEGRVKISVCE